MVYAPSEIRGVLIRSERSEDIRTANVEFQMILSTLFKRVVRVFVGHFVVVIGCFVVVIRGFVAIIGRCVEVFFGW